jgi:hypothetical protein
MKLTDYFLFLSSRFFFYLCQRDRFSFICIFLKVIRKVVSETKVLEKKNLSSWIKVFILKRLKRVNYWQMIDYNSWLKKYNMATRQNFFKYKNVMIKQTCTMFVYAPWTHYKYTLFLHCDAFKNMFNNCDSRTHKASIHVICDKAGPNTHTILDKKYWW